MLDKMIFSSWFTFLENQYGKKDQSFREIRTYALMDGMNFGSSDSIDGANSVTNLAMTLLNNSLDNS
ncbi:hypothetical protein [Cysteiniphilum litorale]|uniref:Uncharacterized protein n=1 Tax=Cysteiniphilum litorale TaxID=2056700 RepID=A0A8J2Z794_9GAMM|nr:hypothetical protein [Cysteiniphilum litorale]GGG09121.1 hypothetical protein GCM10010995_28400 [Cysteiniphilum litorale]